MIGFGAITCIWPFANAAIYTTDVSNITFMQTAKLYLRELCLALGFIIGGIGILKKQLWARKVCLTALALAFFYGGNKIAWLWAGNTASVAIHSGAYLLSFLLFGILFLILFQKLTEDC